MGRQKKIKPHPNMEYILQYIGKNYINLEKGKKRSANKELNRVLMSLTSALKQVSPLFKKMFETYLYAGSSYDGLKIGKPDEFDIDFKLYLPAILDVQVINSDKHGFVYLWLKDWERLKKDVILYATFRELEQFIDEKHYLSHIKIKEWMQSIVTKAINIVNLKKKFGNLNVTYKTSGPAVTLIITNTKNSMTVDLVPVFRIEDKKWPLPPVKKNTFGIMDYVVVPKGPKVINKPLGDILERYWRLSFPEQEMEYMKGFNSLKPSLRCLKKLRDTRTHNIPSYFIKTIFLSEINKQSRYFWQQSFTNVFIEMLKIYKTSLQNRKILYFWDENHNLIDNMSEENIENIFNYLEKMINEIENLKNTQPIIVAKYLLPEDDYLKVCKELNVIAI